MRRTLFSALPFNPYLWTSPAALNYANCYTYALGDQDLITVLTQSWNPGDLSETPPRDYSPKDYVRLAKSDGLLWTGNRIKLRKDTYPVALFCPEENDYHWLRMNSDGTWSGKSVSQPPVLLANTQNAPVRNLEETVLPIIWEDGKPRDYTLIGYFNVPRSLSMEKLEASYRLLRTLRLDADTATLRFGCRPPVSLSTLNRTLTPEREALRLKPSGPLVIPKA